MQFTIRQLEIFVEAARDENFRVTADRLGISQPTLSAHVKALERAIGGVLFDRQRGSSARLSAHGKAMLDRARLLLAEARKVSGDPAPGTGERAVRVIAGPIIIDRLIKPALAEYHALPGAPGLELEARTNGDEAYSKLRSGDADFAIFTGDIPDIPGLTVEPLALVEVAIFACPRLAAHVGGDPERISAAPWIGGPAGSPLESWLGRLLSAVGISPSNIAVRSQFTEVTLDLALKGNGLAVLFETDARPLVEEGKLVRLPMALKPGYRFVLTRGQPADPQVAMALSYWRRKLA